MKEPKDAAPVSALDFYDLSEDTIKTIKDLYENMAISFNIKIKYLGDPKMKRVILLKKANKEIKYLNAIDLLIYINEDYFIKLEKKNAEILIYQELDRLVFDLQKGTFKIGKYPLQTTAGVLKKYGIDAVAEANEISELYTKQVKDGQADNFDAKEQAKKTTKKSVEFLS